MFRFEDDNRDSTPGHAGLTRPIAKASEMSHPDFHTLLNYAEGGLNLEAHRRVGGHILICGSCSSELNQIKSEIIPHSARLIGLVERGHWLAALATGRLRRASDLAGKRDGDPSPTILTGRFGNLRRSASMTYGLMLALTVTLLVLAVREVQRSRLHGLLASRTAEVETLNRQNESLKQESLVQQARAQQMADSAGQEARELLANKQTAMEQRLSQLESENTKLKVSLARSAPPVRMLAELQDTSGVATVSSDSTVSILGMTSAVRPLPPSLARPVTELVTAGTVKPREPELLAMTSPRNDPTRSVRLTDTPPPMPLSPVRMATRSTTPTLRWEHVPGAKDYKVRVVSYSKDKGGEKIIWQSLGAVPGTQVPVDPKRLRRGQVYFWYVETEIRGQVRISPVVGFWVLDNAALRQVEAAEREYNDSALALAAVYARYGLYDEALAQVERLAALNPDSPLVQTMLRKLRR